MAALRFAPTRSCVLRFPRARRPPVQLGRVRRQDIPAHLALEILPLPPGIHQPRAHELLDVMRDRRLRYRKLVPEPSAGAFPLARDRLQQRHASRVREGLGDELELPSGQAESRTAARGHSSMDIELLSGCQEDGEDGEAAPTHGALRSLERTLRPLRPLRLLRPIETSPDSPDRSRDTSPPPPPAPRSRAARSSAWSAAADRSFTMRRAATGPMPGTRSSAS